jgi:hypothetical protein
MWHLWNGGDRRANARKAGMTKGDKQLPMTSRAKTGPRNGGHLRQSACDRRDRAAGAAQRDSRATQGVDSRSRHCRAMWADL